MIWIILYVACGVMTLLAAARLLGLNYDDDADVMVGAGIMLFWPLAAVMFVGALLVSALIKIGRWGS